MQNHKFVIIEHSCVSQETFQGFIKQTSSDAANLPVCTLGRRVPMHVSIYLTHTHTHTHTRAIIKYRIFSIPSITSVNWLLIFNLNKYNIHIRFSSVRFVISSLQCMTWGLLGKNLIDFETQSQDLYKNSTRISRAKD